MTKRRGTALAAAVSTILALGACGNDAAFNADMDSAKSVFKQISGSLSGKQTGAASQVTGEMLSSTLAATPRPVYVVQFEEKGSGLVSLIETNGAYQTFGNSARQAMIFRNGVLSGTRGLGGDLMSSDIGTVGLITARRAGQGERVSRHLDGEGKTVETRFSCAVSVGESKPVAFALVQGTGLVVNETCTAPDLQITNNYVVDGGGRVLWSRQWIGPGHGAVVIVPARL